MFTYDRCSRKKFLCVIFTGIFVVVLLTFFDVCWTLEKKSATKPQKKLSAQKEQQEKKSVQKEQKEGPKELKEGVKFVYYGKAKKVNIAGSFNNWNSSGDVLKEEKPGVWSIILPLTPGKYEYKFIVDNNWTVDPSNPQKVADPQGNENSVFVVKGPAGLSGPQILKEGVKFSFYAPNAKEVYIAGDFNNWADNQDGVITNKEYLMEMDKNGVWSKTISISPGRYKYKFVVDGNWTADPLGELANDDYGNSLVKVSPAGIELGPKITANGVVFSYYAPNAEKVYIAGEFNNWADNQSGVVSDDKYLMSKDKMVCGQKQFGLILEVININLLWTETGLQTLLGSQQGMITGILLLK